MPHKRIFILNGHPGATCLNRALAEAYAETAVAAGHEVRITHLHDLRFDADFEFGGYKTIKELEPDLEKVFENLKWSEHLVLTTPMWWGGLPAKLKGLFDRMFLPGQAFNTRETDWMGFPKPMLSGRTGRVIITSDTPGWFLRLVYGNAMVKQVKTQILGFVGIKPVKVSYFAAASHPEEGVVDRWLGDIRKVAHTGI